MPFAYLNGRVFFRCKAFSLHPFGKFWRKSAKKNNKLFRWSLLSSLAHYVGAPKHQLCSDTFGPISFCFVRSYLQWSSLWLPCIICDYSLRWLMGENGCHVTYAITNMNTMCVQCAENQYRCLYRWFSYHKLHSMTNVWLRMSITYCTISWRSSMSLGIKRAFIYSWWVS